MPELYPYQHDGVAHLMTSKAALLADGAGVGKSPQLIEASRPYANVLYVTLASLLENTRREFKKWGREATVQRGAKTPVPSGGVVIISYDTLRLPGIFEQLDHHWDVIIFDESHALKTPSSKRTQVALGNAKRKGLAQCSDRIWFATGTPVMSHVGELWPMLQAVRPDLVGGLSYNAFVQKHCETRRHPQWGIQVTGHKPEQVAELRRKMEDGFMLRRLKRDVLPDLPPLHLAPLFVDVDAAAINRLEVDLINAAADGSIPAMDILIDPLDPDLTDPDTHIATLRRQTEYCKVREILKVIRADLEGGMEKLVVFAHHHITLEALSRGLHDIACSYVDGRMTAEDRQANIDSFHEGEARVFIGQIQAAGTGLTLHANGRCSDVLFCSLDFTPAINEQAMMRIHRIGQPNACLVRYAVASGTFDERVSDILAAKTRRVSDLMEVDQ